MNLRYQQQESSEINSDRKVEINSLEKEKRRQSDEKLDDAKIGNEEDPGRK